ncbi:MAG: hypothetical protein WCC03_06730 [Candidatus Acidiferrales bacterium]
MLGYHRDLVLFAVAVSAVAPAPGAQFASRSNFAGPAPLPLHPLAEKLPIDYIATLEVFIVAEYAR